MSYQGVDLTTEAGQASTGISWHDPHPIFVIILVGPEEIPFGIQKDLLCAQSPYYRDEFSKQGGVNQVELLVKLPETDIATFGCFQNFIYTGALYDKTGGKDIPDYPLLMGVWKLATRLRMAPLRVAVLDTMAERRQLTSHIPGTPLLIQAWQETEEGSGLRTMLIRWAAEHMRASPEIRNAFAKSLPQEILSELVIVMSDLPSGPTFAQPPKHQLQFNPAEIDIEQPRPSTKRSRKSEAATSIPSIPAIPTIPVIPAGDEPFEIKPLVKKAARRSEPTRRVSTNNRRASGPGLTEAIPLSPEKELEFCRDLIQRMFKGPGFWTRLVGPFKNPVDPAVDNVPNYFDVVKRPMDLRSIQAKMNKGEYATSAEFEADIRLIFQNCYEYWTQDDPIFKNCTDFENYFNNVWSTRHKWTTPTIKSELID